MVLITTLIKINLRNAEITKVLCIGPKKLSPKIIIKKQPKSIALLFLSYNLPGAPYNGTSIPSSAASPSLHDKQVSNISLLASLVNKTQNSKIINISSLTFPFY